MYKAREKPKHMCLLVVDSDNVSGAELPLCYGYNVRNAHGGFLSRA